MVYRIARLLAEGLMMILLFPKISGRENFPKTGGCIVVCNHTAWLDPFILAGVCRRQIRYMAKIELFRSKILAWLIGLIGGFPVDRGNADINAIRTSIKIVKGGEILGIFPEGHRNATGEITKIENGVALIAMKSGSPIVPVYIGAPYRLFRRIKIVVGKPLDVSMFAHGNNLALGGISELISKFFNEEREKLGEAKRGKRLKSPQ